MIDVLIDYIQGQITMTPSMAPWKYQFFLWSTVDFLTFFFYLKMFNLIRQINGLSRQIFPIIILLFSYIFAFSVIFANDYFVIETIKLIMQYGVIFYVYIKNREHAKNVFSMLASKISNKKLL